jgi:hypothetical protein
MGHESLIARFERTGASRSRRRKTTSTDYRALSCLPSPHQTLLEAATRKRACASNGHSRTHSEERSGAAGTRWRTAARAKRCAAGRLLSDVGKPIRSQAQPEHDEPSDPACRLHTKKKMLAVTPQKQQERAAWRAQASQLDARQLVFIDECGSNIAVLPTLRLGTQRAASHRLGPSQSRQEHDLDCLFGLGWDGGVHDYRGSCRYGSL